MIYAADLHIHSKYSRATSGECVPSMLEKWAARKGISLIGTGDFTHPAWRQLLNQQLEEGEGGLYRLKGEFRAEDPFAPPDAVKPQFVVSGEISSIYKQDGRVRKVHSLILLPSLEAAEKLSARLEAIGNIHSDGRPILGLSAHDLLEVTLESCPAALFIPAHIWTPHFSLFGAFSGFDRIEECFGDLTKHIHALETGLSSDPDMNHRLSALDRYTLVSNSDAHSPAKLGREMNLIEGIPSYEGLKSAIEGGTRSGFHSTIEFFPEEGKYHFDGHRNCGVCLAPAEAAGMNNLCPVCGKRMTTGVDHRVMQLADRPEGCAAPREAAPFEKMVPLQEVIAAVSGVSAASVKVQARYEALIHALGDELTILRSLPVADIERTAGKAVAEGVRRMRMGEIRLLPGFDGEYGKIELLNEDERRALTGQMTFLDALVPKKAASDNRSQNLIAPSTDEMETVKRTLNESSDFLQRRQENPGAFSGLNDEQRMAVEAAESTVAVIAGPGSGKTKTLIARIAYLLGQGVKPEKIAAVTFTNKAAAELRERLTRQLGHQRAVQGMTIGTFHSISLTLLRRTRPGLSPLDEAGLLSLAGEFTGGLALNSTPAKFLKEMEEGTLDQEILSMWRERLLSLNAASFDDLLIQEIDDPLQPEFTHLLVDEYQDIDDHQRALVEKWNRTGESLFVIGDADQSIYGFRGADASCFDRLMAAHPDARRIQLRMNYRSAPEILACALPVIAKNGGARDLTAGREAGGTVRCVRVADEYAEAIAIAREIGRMVGGMDMIEAQAGPSRQIGFSDVAILYRMRRQAEAIEKCLAMEGIPCVIAGRGSELNAPEVEKAIHFFRLCLNPWNRAALHALLPEVKLNIAPGETADSLCAKLNEAGGEELAAQLALYAPKIAKEKPKKLLERWKKDQGIRSEAFDRLLHAAMAAPDMASLLSDIILGMEGDLMRSGGKTYTADAVRLMTLHGSKGLEFPVVFIAGMKRGVLPAETPYGRETDIQEERRLFYVGMTRAKDELILMSHPEESVFLQEIPQELMSHERAAYQPKAEAGKQLSFL